MKLAIVIPWFGRALKGGAEQHAWQIAARLAARGHQVEVLTTCCRSHQEDWATNHLPAGESNEPEGFGVHRFPVTERNRAAFDRVCGALLQARADAIKPGVSPVSPADAEIFTNELIKSPRLLDFLSAKKRDYDWFIFLPYLYGPTIKGIEIVGERAALQPCLHDEAYAYLPEVAESFYRAGKILFISEGERELALRLFGPGIWERSELVGGGVEVSAELSVSDLARNGQTERYVLYLGRKDAGKNVPLLLNAFHRFRSARPNSKLRLLLAGNGSIGSQNGNPDTVQDLGLVSEERKQSLLHGCAALFQPSQNESFSRVMMEAWMHGKPVAAHSSCLATAVAVERAAGGWLAATEREWANLFAEVDRLSPKQLSELGAKGRDYAVGLASWDKVLDRYETALEKEDRAPSVRRAPEAAGKRIDQFLPNLVYGDAISNYAIWTRDLLRGLGFDSQIHVRYIDERVAHECTVFSPAALQRCDAAIYHHSIGTEITPHLVNFSGPKCLIYHNITPAEFFAPYWPQGAVILDQGRHDLAELAADFRISCGVSVYNAEELEANGFHRPSIAPIPVDPEKWNFAPDPDLMTELQDGRTNLLFVGRTAPNKKQDDLVVAFDHYLDLDPDARLILVGKAEADDPYAAHVQGLILDRELQNSVVYTGNISSHSELAAYYRTAHLFWSMSEHEGFCVPLVEAMWFDLPVLAYRSSAVPETLGAAGILFTNKEDPSSLAALAHLLVKDSSLRAKVIRAQRKQRLSFLPSAVRPIMLELIDRLLGSCAGSRRSAAGQLSAAGIGAARVMI